MSDTNKPLTAAELAELRRIYDEEVHPGIPRWGKYGREWIGPLLAAAEECERLRAENKQLKCDLDAAIDTMVSGGEMPANVRAVLAAAGVAQRVELEAEVERLRAALTTLTSWLKIYAAEYDRYNENVRLVPYGYGSPGPSLGQFRRAAEALGPRDEEGKT